MKRHEKYFTGLTLEGDELFFFLSLIEGDHVGRDNTCKTALELKTTFVDKAPLLHLSDLIKTLKIDMIFLSRDKGTEKELLGCARLLYQAKMYKRLLLDVIHYSHGASDEGQWVKENFEDPSFPMIPMRIQKAMTKGKNIAGVLLAPMASDRYTRVIDHVFSLKRGDDSVFGRLLREGFDSDEFKRSVVVLPYYSDYKNACLSAGLQGSVESLCDSILNKSNELIKEHDVKEQVFAV